MRTFLCFMLSSLLVLAACSDDKPTQGSVDPTGAQLLVDRANDSLASVMQTAIDSILEYGDSSFRPSDLDFSGVHAIYQQAVAKDPANLDARFGAGFTALLTVFADPDVNALYERTKRFVDTTVATRDWQLPLTVMRIPTGILGPDLLPTGWPVAPRDAIGLLPDVSSLDRALQVSAAADPQPSDFQSVLENRVLPKVRTARDHLAQVVVNRDYVFWITPDMQANAGADSIEIDMTEVRLALAALYGFEAAINVATARHLDVPEYSQSGLEEAFNTGSSFLTLKSDGAAKMRAAKSSLLNALAEVDSALGFLLTETDVDQDNDLIPRGGDVAEIRDSVRSVKRYLTEVRSVEITNRGYTLNTNVDLAKFFDQPWDDPKELVPDYEFTMSYDSAYRDIEPLYFNAQRYWDSLLAKFGIQHPHDTTMFPDHLPDVKNSEYYRVIGECQAIWGWDDPILNWGDGQQCYHYYSNHQMEYGWAWYDRTEIEICTEWTSDNFADWTFNDPTFGGLFPGLTNTQVKDFIMPSGASEWDKRSCGNLGL